MRVFIGGLGYCGSRIAAAIHVSYPECVISGTVRSTERHDAMLASPPAWLTGNVHLLDLDDGYTGLLHNGGEDGGEGSGGIDELKSATHIIQTIAPIADLDTDPLLSLHGSEIMDSDQLQYVAYLSSTGVYGDHDGEWVNEEPELKCIDAKSMARVRAEGEWMQLESGDGSDGIRVDCFRCGGIYGPGRGPLFSSMESLNAALADDEGEAENAGGNNENDETQQQQRTAVPKYVNRIMVDDICGAILASISGERCRCGGRAYNLVDDDPAPRRAVVAEARRLLLSKDSKQPQREQRRQQDRGLETTIATKNTRRRISRATGNKRCDNTRLKEEYGWELKALTFREGLALLLENGDLLR